MVIVKASNSAWILCAHILFATGAAAFSGNFEITNLAVDCPSETNATSTADSFLCFEFADQDTPETPPAQCCLQWAAGQTPAALPADGTCSDSSITVCVPVGQYGGFQNMTVNLAHTYEDDSVGQAPNNMLTKYAPLALQYPTTPDYECDMNAACCELCEGKTMTAIVTQATS